MKYRALPHAGYVLQRLETASLEGLELELETARLKGLELEIEHIFPQSPTDTWSGDGQREWASFTEEERARHRALLQTLGNLALLEQPLNAGASNKPFTGEERRTYTDKARSARRRRWRMLSKRQTGRRRASGMWVRSRRARNR